MIIFDIETKPRLDLVDRYLKKFDSEEVKTGNLKDPAKIAEKILQAEPDPAIYVYHQQFQWLGQSFLRRGLMANVRLERFGQGKIYPHEQTHARAKEDRLEMLRTCRANLSQIFGLYQDPENQIQELLESKILGVLGTEAIDHLGVRHSIWPISDLTTIQEISSRISSLPMFVADGHHRYETACNYRDELAAAGKLNEDDPANFVLTALVSMSDPGLIVLPTHRLLHGIPRFSTEQLREKLDKYFDCELVAKGPESAGAVWAELDRLDEQLIIFRKQKLTKAHKTKFLFVTKYLAEPLICHPKKMKKWDNDRLILPKYPVCPIFCNAYPVELVNKNLTEAQPGSTCFYMSYVFLIDPLGVKYKRVIFVSFCFPYPIIGHIFGLCPKIKQND
jgi:hypothetical protein